MQIIWNFLHMPWSIPEDLILYSTTGSFHKHVILGTRIGALNLLIAFFPLHFVPFTECGLVAMPMNCTQMLPTHHLMTSKLLLFSCPGLETVDAGSVQRCLQHLLHTVVSATPSRNLKSRREIANKKHPDDVALRWYCVCSVR